jgi:hypothetical protein
MKRIIVFCDGTGQDGLDESGPAYTNVLVGNIYLEPEFKLFELMLL